MILAAVVGLALKFSESFLGAVPMQRKDGTYCGYLMVTLTRAFPGSGYEDAGCVFCRKRRAGISNGQYDAGNPIALAMQDTFGGQEKKAPVLTILLLVVTGGLRSIAKSGGGKGTGNGTLYLGGAGMGIGSARRRASADTACEEADAFFPGGIGGAVVWNFPLPALRYGISRGVFSNEAGLGAGISAGGGTDRRSCGAGVHQQTGVFVDTMVIQLPGPGLLLLE